MYLLSDVSNLKYRIWGAAVFGVSLATDFFDGYLARRLQEITWLGKIMDPLADKLVVITGLLFTVAYGYVHPIIASIIIGREISVSALRSLASTEGTHISSSLPARIKVFAEGFGIGFILLGPTVTTFGIPWMKLGELSLYAGVVLALWSGINYFIQFYRQVR